MAAEGTEGKNACHCLQSCANLHTRGSHLFYFGGPGVLSSNVCWPECLRPLVKLMWCRLILKDHEGRPSKQRPWSANPDKDKCGLRKQEGMLIYIYIYMCINIFRDIYR